MTWFTWLLHPTCWLNTGLHLPVSHPKMAAAGTKPLSVRCSLLAGFRAGLDPAASCVEVEVEVCRLARSRKVPCEPDGVEIAWRALMTGVEFEFHNVRACMNTCIRSPSCCSSVISDWRNFVLAGYTNICRACDCFVYLLSSMKFRVFWDVLPCSQMSTDVSEVGGVAIRRGG
jgi:hypothetical protein